MARNDINMSSYNEIFHTTSRFDWGLFYSTLPIQCPYCITCMYASSESVLLLIRMLLLLSSSSYLRSLLPVRWQTIIQSRTLILLHFIFQKKHEIWRRICQLLYKPSLRVSWTYQSSKSSSSRKQESRGMSLCDEFNETNLDQDPLLSPLLLCSSYFTRPHGWELRMFCRRFDVSFGHFI